MRTNRVRVDAEQGNGYESAVLSEPQNRIAKLESSLVRSGVVLMKVDIYSWCRVNSGCITSYV